MTGYQEIFTDPSYFGQILVTATSHIGNYGVHPDEVESESVNIAGLVCKKFSAHFSRKAAGGSIQDYFESHNLVGISDVDTRSLVRHIRNKGAMNAIISSDIMDVAVLKKQLDNVPSMEGLELASNVCTSKPYQIGNENSKYRVALIDLGTKKNIIRCLVDRDCCVRVFPMNTDFQELLSWGPDGIMLSNGPGDPVSLKNAIQTAGKIIKSNIPAFGICLGHQVLALAVGLSTYKMHNGHRGVNHPVKNLSNGKCEITSQNHGFVVSLEDAEASKKVEVTHLHLNDNTLAGFKIKNKKIFSVQFHPESAAGPNDSRYLFDLFTGYMSKNAKKSNNKEHHNT
jgi:carbamoyl-phosphate synthase small subunit